MPVQTNFESSDECKINSATSLEINKKQISTTDEDASSKQFPAVYKYSHNNFQLSVESKHGYEVKSLFDKALQGTWEAAKDKGAFNYVVDSVETKILPGKYNIVAQLNVRRGTLRRKPEEILSITQPFNSDKFNFTKIKAEETLFNLEFERNLTSKNENGFDATKDVPKVRPLEGSVIINTAPICYGHSLLLPHLNECRPQVLNKEGIELAIHTVLLSESPSLRVGFNSLCAYASVNHYHFHMYYLPFQLFIETAECERLCGPCFIFKDFYSKCFVFQLENNDACSMASSVMCAVDVLLAENIPHNLYITRGKSIENDGTKYDTVRVLLIPRKSSYEFQETQETQSKSVQDYTYCQDHKVNSISNDVENGAKLQHAFNPALCELSGHVPIYSSSHWSTISESDIVPVMQGTCQIAYDAVLPKIKQAFAQK